MASTLCDNRFQVLCYEQVARLHDVMEDVIPIHGRGNFPTLDIKLKDLVQVVSDKLKADGVIVRDIRLNGGVASYVLGTTNAQEYNDVDLIFGVDLSNQNELQKIRNCVLGCIVNFLPNDSNKDNINSCTLKEAYV